MEVQVDYAADDEEMSPQDNPQHPRLGIGAATEAFGSGAASSSAAAAVPTMDIDVIDAPDPNATPISGPLA
eukprot:3399706-Prorocentrum_lima.AAC.1